MRALLQRVTEASVSVDGKVIGETGPGLMILACAMQGDTEANVAAIAAQAPFVRDWFDLPDDDMILCAISFGHPDMSHPINNYRTAREAPDAIIDWKS